MKLDDNYRIYFAPPPSSGILVAFMMKIMRGFDVKAQDWLFANTTNLFYHRFVEAMKHAYSLRLNFGDPNYVDMTKVSLIYSKLGKKISYRIYKKNFN
jgi:gamma-glutamyltranspeptidase/glutathione hydrolase/leukotriene-C4 hydrolase